MLPKVLLDRATQLLKTRGVVPLDKADDALKAYHSLSEAAQQRLLARKSFRAAKGKNVVTALADKNYQSLLKKQLGEYTNEVINDVSNPKSTLLRQTKMITHDVTPSGEIVKRSPLGEAGMATMLFGLPLYYGGQELNNPDPRVSTSEKLVRAATTTIPAALTPKALPSFLAMSIPEVIYRDGEDPRLKKMKKYMPYGDVDSYYDYLHSIGVI